MKQFSILGLLFFSAQAFSSTYVGSNNGAACTLRLDDLARNSISLDSGAVNVGIIPSNIDRRDSQTIKVESVGGLEKVRITVTLDSKNEPLIAKLEKKVLLPYYSTKLVCSNFVKTN